MLTSSGRSTLIPVWQLRWVMDAINPIRKQRADWVAGALWCAVILLIVIGVVASTGRTMFPGDFGIRADPIRTAGFHALNRLDPAASHREQEIRFLDSKFGAHRFATWMHVIPGAIFLLFAPMQFSSRVRGRYLRFHRWSGRLLVVTAFAAVVPGFYFGLFMPYGGVGESVVIALGGGIFLAALTKAIIAIRRHDVARHREWMIRAFAMALGISTIRLAVGILDLALTPSGFAPRELFVAALWMGWGLTLGMAEVWIQRTRGRLVPMPSA